MNPTNTTQAPTAPVEASGSEREQLGRFGHHPDPAIDFCVEVECIEGMTLDAEVGLQNADEVRSRLSVAMMFRVGGDAGAVAAKDILRRCEKRLAALRPQPSGETRDIGAASRLTKLIEDGENLKKAYHPSTFSDPVSSFWCDVAALSTTPARAEAQDEGAAGLPKFPADLYEEYPAMSAQSHEAAVKEYARAAVAMARAHPSPPPAQDEGAAGERDRLVAALADALAFIDDMGTDLHRARVADWYPEGANNAAVQMSEDMRLAGNRCATYEPLVDLNEIGSSHPSPPPAADADRVRAWDALAAHVNWELSYGWPDEEEAGCWLVSSVNGGWNDREWTVIGRGETPLDAALAALKSTAAKEGGEP